MAHDPAARYPSVPALQADLTACQNGFATGAERAGAWKQLKLLIKRNKAASIGAAAVLLVGTVFGTSTIVQGRRATAALADLKKTAPALRDLAETQARTQNFKSALRNLDAALELDRDLPDARWRRAWLLLCMEQWSAAAEAVRRAKRLDPANTSFAAILPVVEELAAAPSEADRWNSDRAVAVTRHLQNVKASGELFALSNRLQLSAKEKGRTIRQQLDDRLGKGMGNVIVTSEGLIQVESLPKGMKTLDPLEGLPIDRLNLGKMKFQSLEPLAKMRLLYLDITGIGPISLEPLRNMPLASVYMEDSPDTDLSPLQGLPLEFLTAHGCGIVNLTPLQGARLWKLSLPNNGISDLRPLADSPTIEHLDLNLNPVASLSPLHGLLRLRFLALMGSRIPDLTPLRGTPLQELRLGPNSQPLDLAPLLGLHELKKLSVDRMHKNLNLLREHPTLEFIDWGEGYKHKKQFWAEYDAQQKAEVK